MSEQVGLDLGFCEHVRNAVAHINQDDARIVSAQHKR